MPWKRHTRASVRERSTTNYIPTLDGWRALSVMAVMAYHATPKSMIEPGSQWGFGVLFFFAISGYLITSRLLSERDAVGAANLKTFYLRRAFRILPPAYAYLGTIALLSAFGVVHASTANLVRAALFAGNLVQSVDWYMAHYWSLAVEEQFYIVWPITLVLLNGRAKWAALALAAASPIARHLAMRHGYSTTLAQYDLLMAGSWWAIVLRDRVNQARLRAFTSGVRWWFLAAALGVAMCVQPPGLSLILLVLIPIVMLGPVFDPEREVSAALEHPLLGWIGRVSYSLYLWQQLFCTALEHEVGRPWTQQAPYNVLMTLACAVISYYAIELPAIAVGKRVAAALQARAGSAAVVKAA